MNAIPTAAAAVLALGLVAAIPSRLHSATLPSFIHYQGHITTPAGASIPDGSYALRFTLHADPATPIALWTQNMAGVSVVRGNFAVALEGITPDILDTAHFLEIKVGDDLPLSPRTPIGNVPLAFIAHRVAAGGVLAASIAPGAVAADAILNNTINSAKLASDAKSFEKITGGLGAYDDLKFTLDDGVFLGLGVTPQVALHVLGDVRIDNGEIQSWGPITFRPDTDLSGDAHVRFLSNAGVERARMHSNGFLGIGTAAPIAPIHVVDNRAGAFPSAAFDSPSTIGTWLRLNNSSPGGRNWNFISSGEDNGEGVGKLLIRDHTSFATRLTIDTTGKVGIGTASPAAPLHVVDDRVSATTVALFDSVSTIGTWLRLNNSSAGGRNWNFISSGEDNGEGAGKLLIRDQTATINHVVVDSTGNVGIGYNSPLFKLHVNGTLAVASLPFGDFRNVQWNDITGQFYFDNSSRRHKENITPLQDNFASLLKAQPKTYTRPGRPDRWEIGYIAEDFDAIGLKKLVDYEQDGITPSGINYEKLGLYLVEIAKSQQNQLESIREKTEELQSLRSENDALRSQLQNILQRLEKLEAASPQLPSSPTFPASGVSAN